MEYNNVNASLARVDGGRFAPGVSGNPGGKPRGLAELIRQKTNNLESQIDTMIAFSKGEPINGVVPKHIEIQSAINWLADRGFGKPTQLIAGDESHAPITINFSAIVPRPSQDDIRKNGNETGK